jgi:hypothetical protein
MTRQDAISPSWLAPPRWLVLLLVLGLYLTLRGYHSRDNDQAYRLPLLLHQQEPALFADDPFVRSFDVFNPHRGYLALLDLASRPFGLSCGLFVLFTLTFGATCAGLDRLARAVWPEKGEAVGLVAIGLALTAKAGNIGTVHVFEAMLLDRLIGFALGWLALAWIVERPAHNGARAALAIGLAAVVHPSVGLQLALLLAGSWAAWTLAGRATGVDLRRAILGLAALGLALLPWGFLYLGQAPRLHAGLPAEEFRLLSAELQSPQHMLPHLWRLQQWLAFGCYPILALLALGRAWKANGHSPEPKTWPAARTRLVIVLAVNLAGLAMAWVAVEVLQSVSVTLFQPFRMATVFRGLVLVAVSGRVVGLWRDGRFVDRARAVLLAVGLAGDWMLVIATAVDLAVSAVAIARTRNPMQKWAWHPGWTAAVFAISLGTGLVFLARHDTESGHWPMLAALAALVVLPYLVRGRNFTWNRRRLAAALAACWAVPLAACLACNLADPQPRWAANLIARCRFAAVPTDDMERLALWCRGHTPTTARFIGPPGPKTFRLWSLRSLAFNRAGSPYHAGGLADWAARFRDHVGFEGSLAGLVRAYQHDRHGLEHRYQTMTDAEHAALAIRQGASYVLASPPKGVSEAHARGGGPLELLHVEGRYAVYRVRLPGTTVNRAPAPPPRQARNAATASAGTG